MTEVYSLLYVNFIDQQKVIEEANKISFVQTVTPLEAAVLDAKEFM
jgi:uncharacterized protein YlbG (UPF0298 family)